FGVTGRRMLAALVAGERDPQVLASLAHGTLKRKRPQLELALTGQFTAHHGTLLALLLELIAVLDRQIATLDQQIGELVAPLQVQIAQLDSIPGVDITAARDILAEIGTDMSRFGDAARLASWAGVCPGNHESAGKRYRGKTCEGDRYSAASWCNVPGVPGKRPPSWGAPFGVSKCGSARRRRSWLSPTK